ncbi:MAG: S8 family peptidase [Tepidiformaceae bacterium]
MTLAVSLAVMAALEVRSGGDLSAEQGESGLGHAELIAIALAVASDELEEDTGALIVQNTTWDAWPLTGVDAFLTKVWSTTTDQGTIVALDAQGNLLSINELNEAELAAREQRFGKLTEELADTVAATDPDSLLDLVIWLAMPTYEEPYPEPLAGSADALSPEAAASISRETADALWEARVAHRAAWASEIVSPILTELEAAGVTATELAGMGAIAVRMRAGDVHLMAAREDVLEIALQTVPDDDLNVSLATTYSNVVHSRGYAGGGVKIGVIERHAKPYAHTNISFTQGAEGSQCGSSHDHPTKVMGVIKSNHATYRGHAYLSPIYVAGGCSSGTYTSGIEIGASDAVAAWSARILNLSWSRDGQTTFNATTSFYEHFTWNNDVVVAASPGNTGSGCSDSPNRAVLNPGLGYNALTIGAYNDRDSVSWLTTPQDELAPCTGYIESSGTPDQIKPEVVAPGWNIVTANQSNGFSSENGTSFSTPVGSAVAALVINRTAALQSYPMAVKAILMAGAGHPLVATPDTPYQRLEEHGAGALVATYADDVAASITGSWGAGGWSCSVPSAYTLGTFTGVAGEYYRVAMAWMSDPQYAYRATEPGSDFDLQILRPNGTVAGGSYTHDSTTEFTEVYATVSGTYSVTALKYRCTTSNPKELGWAWMLVP